MANKGPNPWLIAIIVLVAVQFLYPGGLIGLKDKFFAAESHELQYEPQDGEVCPAGYIKVGDGCLCNVEDTSISLRGYEKDNPGTTGGMSYFQVYVNDMELSDTDGSFTASPGDDITVYALSNSTEGDIEYYTVKDEFTVGCAGTLTKEYKIPAPAIATISFYNENHDLIKGSSYGANNVSQDIDVNELISTVDMKISGVYEDYFSPFGPMVAVFKFYQSEIDDVKITACDSGRTVKAVSVPNNITSTTNFAFSAYEIGPTGTMSSEEITCDLLIDAGATNPDMDDGNITVTLMDSDYYKPSNENYMALGIENPETRISVGAADINGTLIIEDD